LTGNWAVGNWNVNFSCIPLNTPWLTIERIWWTICMHPPLKHPMTDHWTNLMNNLHASTCAQFSKNSRKNPDCNRGHIAPTTNVYRNCMTGVVWRPTVWETLYDERQVAWTRQQWNAQLMDEWTTSLRTLDRLQPVVHKILIPPEWCSHKLLFQSSTHNQTRMQARQRLWVEAAM
jgi:hypothetical protein